MDMNRAIKYFQNLSNLPEEVDIFLQSKLSADFIRELNSEYNLPEEYLTDFTINLVVENFSVDFIDKINQTFASDLKIDDKKAIALTIDYLGRMVLPISPYLKNLDVRKNISRLGGDIKKFYNHVEKFQDLIEDYVFDEMGKILEEREKHFDVKKEEQALENILTRELVYTLNNPSKELNGGIIALLFADANFKNVVAKDIANSQERLFAKEIEVDGKRFAPTVSSWINNFISVHGSGFFSSIILSDYITNSKFAKNLENSEKELLIKLLSLYRNVKFFPQSLENISPEKWEIFLLDKQAQSPFMARQPLAAPRSQEEAEIANLEKMAEGYELGSLERRAIEEEIRKMKLSIRYQSVRK